MKTKEFKLKKDKVPYNKKPEKISFKEWQIALRKQFALDQKFKIKNSGEHPVYSDFDVTNPTTQKTYKVAIRSNTIGYNFCSCPDFKVNNLGTCKHIEYVFAQLRSKKSNEKIFNTDYKPSYTSVTLKYGTERKIVLRIGSENNAAFKELATDFFDKQFFLKEDAINNFGVFIEKAHQLDPAFRCYPDALEFVIAEREKKRRHSIIEKNTLKAMMMFN